MPVVRVELYSDEIVVAIAAHGYPGYDLRAVFTTFYDQALGILESVHDQHERQAFEQRQRNEELD